LTIGYEILQERQKCLEYMLNKKMSKDIHNIQQILDNMTRQTKEEGQNNKASNIVEAKKQSYASMLMYNSY
jgi:hypothetical protein